MKRLLDLFCGAGGAAVGYQRAGFEVTGVDITAQPRFPFTFMQADALTFPLDGYDAIHASPPCQDHIRAPGAMQPHGTGWMLGAVRERLQQHGTPWVIENVPGAPMRVDLRLCGCMFGLRRLQRQRWFETSWRPFVLTPACQHPEHSISVTGRGTPTGTYTQYGSLRLRDFQAVMGIAWMNRRELSQALPPAYTEYIGRLLLARDCSPHA